jgi:chaperonin GroES
VTDKKDKIPSILIKYLNLDNIAEELSEDRLVEIGSDIAAAVDHDEESRIEWREQMEESLKLAKQTVDGKSYPWPGAANVRYPLLLEAAVQFNARTNPEVVQGDKVVEVSVMIPDPTGDQEDRADRLSSHMSYQLLGQSDNWRSDTDRLLMTLPLVGVCYRKSYYDSIEKRPQIDFCLPQDIVINNAVASLESAPRITHILHMSNNDLLERMRAGIYSKYSLEELTKTTDEDSLSSASSDYVSNQYEVNNHELYEQHCWLDLDDDDYEEPYIVVVHKESKKVLRIVARFDESSFIFHKNTNEFVKIKAIQYFTDYHFIPAPDGTFHSMGFGSILYPLNETINTLLNQLLDAGTLANRQGGFIGKSLRIRKEELRFKPGEWKQINVPSGTSLAQNVYPLPVNEPSPALFNLLGMIINSGKELANVSEVLQGQPPGANTPATTVMAIVEQGMKVFSSMMSRLYVSFKKEFQKLYLINKKYLDTYETYAYTTASGMVSLADYQAPEYGVFPVANPNQASDAHRLAQAQALMQIMNAPGIDQQEVLMRYLNALRIQQPNKILPPPDPNAPPPPQAIMEMETAQAALAHQKMTTADILMRRELEAIRLNLEQERNQAQAAYWGGQVASQKIESVSKLAETEALVGEQDVNIASKQADVMQKQADMIEQIEPSGVGIGSPEDIEMRVGRIETLMNQLAGTTQQSPMEQQEPNQNMAPEGESASLNPTQQAPTLPPELAQELQGIPSEAEESNVLPPEKKKSKK